MSKYFYAHIVSPEDIRKELDVLDITDDEKDHLMIIVESTFHHAVVDVLLEEMHDDHKHVFLDHIVTDNHDAIWQHLNEHVNNPEEKIRSVVNTVKAELLKDIFEVQRTKLSAES